MDKQTRDETLEIFRSDAMSLKDKAILAADCGIQFSPGLAQLRTVRKIPGSVALAFKYGGAYGKVAAVGAVADKHLERAAENVRAKHDDLGKTVDPAKRPDLDSGKPDWNTPLSDGAAPDPDLGMDMETDIQA